MKQRATTKIPVISPMLRRMFLAYAKRYIARNLHALRMSRRGGVPVIPDGPVILVANHPSWWDPLVCLVLSGLFPDRAHFAPIDAAALQRYRFFAKLGFFGVEQGTARGAREFLRNCDAIFSLPNSALWITAQGRFTDPRERPVRVMGGVGHAAHWLGRGTILPVAVEFPFWDERFPEALVRFGDLIPITHDRTAGEWTELVERALAATQDALAKEAIARDAAVFDVVVGGRAGVGGVYDLWRRLRARWRGEKFEREHGAIQHSSVRRSA